MVIISYSSAYNISHNEEGKNMKNKKCKPKNNPIELGLLSPPIVARTVANNRVIYKKPENKKAMKCMTDTFPSNLNTQFSVKTAKLTCDHGIDLFKKTSH